MTRKCKKQSYCSIRQLHGKLYCCTGTKIFCPRSVNLCHS